MDAGNAEELLLSAMRLIPRIEFTPGQAAEWRERLTAKRDALRRPAEKSA
jgi:hypothetical protein